MRRDMKKSIYGYSQEEVDQFLYKLSTDYKELYSENSQLKKRIFAAEDRLKSYIAIEKGIKETLEMSKNASAQAREHSHDKSDIIIKEAREKAKRMVEEAKEELELMQGSYERIKADFERFCDRHNDFMDEQLDIFKNMEKNQDESL
jgi:cell division initiation protein